MDDPFGLVQVAEATPVQPGEPLGQHHVASVEHALYRAAQGMTVETVTVDHAGRETVVSKQLPPNVPAAQAILTALAPQRWQAPDQPRLAVQYVVNLPSVSADSQAWLRDIGRASTAAQPATATIEHGPVLPHRVSSALTVASEAGRLVPAASGPVPDPLAVPPRH